ncbi:MAG TPA: cytochrome-c peroxidase [Candidatus Paenalcaligenes intestinipullorum]|uniref:Cytochrome-c peroxidase n=1 Tax=Candidatus Paenalcaligenes intestinipullorum TaxID=2838718 RepID=A0A9D2RGM9_9BURK|nr:cytochrome-c peroxidase [Candidatus Paenalcaligenes intestinipullorum]
MKAFKATFLAVALSVGFAGATTAQQNEPIKPIPPAEVTDKAKVELGKKLFFEPRLSKSGFISCNSCHNLSRGGSDNLPTSIGDNWQQGPINSPTVLNSSLNLAQFWDGRAANLQEQAGGPIANPMEMAFTHELAIGLLTSIPAYVEEFETVYGTKEITIDEVTDAIAAFEETLVTPDSRFDLWLNGDQNALTKQEIAGYQLFKASGCVACHNGVNVGGASYQKMGVVEPYTTENKAEGRAAVTGVDADRFNFKVPTLRNVEMTYPYFHDGAVDTLTEAVDIMGRLQLGRHFTKEENAQIVAFLKTLTGKQPEIVLPILPPSADETVRPTPFN